MTGEKLGRDFASAPHQFFGWRGDAKLFFVKLNRKAVVHTQYVPMIFAAISDAIFGQQFRVDLILPRLGVGQNAIEIENHCAKGLSHLKL